MVQSAGPWWGYFRGVLGDAWEHTGRLLRWNWLATVTTTVGWFLGVWFTRRGLGPDAAMSEITQKVGEAFFLFAALPVGLFVVYALFVVPFLRHERQEAAYKELQQTVAAERTSAMLALEQTKAQSATQVCDLRSQVAALQDRRAAIELRFENREPYVSNGGLWLRLEVYNHGPATAEDVRVKLLSMEPNPLHSSLLPSALTFKGVQTEDAGKPVRVQRGDTRLFDLCSVSLAVAPSPIIGAPNRTSWPVIVWVAELAPEQRTFTPNEGNEYRLSVLVTADNADPLPREYTLLATGGRLALIPAAPSAEPTPSAPPQTSR